MAKGDSLPNAEKELALSIRKTYDQYQYLFYFLPNLQEYAQQRIDLGKQKHLATKEEKNPNTKFVENKVIIQISENSDLLKYANLHSVQMQESMSVVRKIYNSILTKDYFINYMNNPERSFEEDRQLVIDIFTEEFEDCEDLYSLLEDQNIYWTDEPEFVVGMIIRTIKGIKEDRPFRLMPLYKNEDDEVFARRLFSHAMINFDKYNKIIAEFTDNWEVERITLMDILILEIAISEMIEFSDIPIKVTLDEYIELARYYSTAGSSQFVNGVLDKIVQYLKDNNKIRKHGIGLIDN